jgi:hypothetical protein
MAVAMGVKHDWPKEAKGKKLEKYNVLLVNVARLS